MHKNYGICENESVQSNQFAIILSLFDGISRIASNRSESTFEIEYMFAQLTHTHP